MKTLITLLTTGAFAAFWALPFNAEITGSIFVASSLAMIFTADYGRRAAFTLRQPSGKRSTETLRLAA
jgi:hypothetical protein